VDRDEEAVEEVFTEMVTLRPVEEEAAGAVDGDEDVAKEVIAETVTLGVVEEEAAVAALAALSLDVPPTLSAGGHMEGEHESCARKRRARRKRAEDMVRKLRRSSRLMAKEEPVFELPEDKAGASSKRNLTLPVRLAACAMLYLVAIFYLIHTISRVVRSLSVRLRKPVAQARRMWSPSQVWRGCRPVKNESRHQEPQCSQEGGSYPS
jgi:hypothetical protein